MENSSKIFYGVLTLAVLVALGWGLVAGGGEGLAFGLFAALTLGGSLICIWERSVVRSAFSLLGTFGGIAGLFVLLEADYLAMAQVLIYVGAILALLLFGVMLTPPDLGERKLPRVLSGLVLLGGAFLFIGLRFASTVHWAVRADAPELVGSNAERIGLGFLRADQYVVAFELAAIVLTVALVAAVYIARRKPSDLKPAGAAGGEGDRI